MPGSPGVAWACVVDRAGLSESGISLSCDPWAGLVSWPGSNSVRPGQSWSSTLLRSGAVGGRHKEDPDVPNNVTDDQWSHWNSEGSKERPVQPRHRCRSNQDRIER